MQSLLSRAICVVAILILAAPSFAADIISVANGTWDNGAVWDSGLEPTGVDDVTIDFHDVSVDSTGAICNSLNVSNLSNTIGVFPGADLTVGTNLHITAGTTFQNNQGTLDVGTLTTVATSVFDIAGGTTDVFGDADFQGSTFSITGGGGNMTFHSNLAIDSISRVRIQPSQNGLAGLTEVDVFGNLTGDIVIDFDETDYVPNFGDSWTLFDFAGGTGPTSITVGTPPAGKDLQINLAKAGIITVTVVPAPGTPANTYWTLAIVIAAICAIGGGFAFGRLDRSGPAIR